MSEQIEELRYYLTEATAKDLSLYRKCFSLQSFCEAYDLTILKSEFESKIVEIASYPFRDLTRLVLYKQGNPISFCHFLFEKNQVKVSGGLTPDLINSGKGVHAAVIFYDHYFKMISKKPLIAEIHMENVRSLKLHYRLGFSGQPNAEKIILKLDEFAFRNPFVTLLLTRLDYEHT